jgi:hypothetical protein
MNRRTIIDFFTTPLQLCSGWRYSPSGALVRLLGVLTVGALVLTACSGGGNDWFVPPATTTAVAYGSLNLPKGGVRANTDVLVRAVTLDGQTLGETHTDSVGSFTLKQLPADFRVLALLPSGLTLSREVRGGLKGWLWINGATTLVSRVMQRNPGMTLDAAATRVRSYLGIAASVNLDSGLGDTWRSPFSWSQFVVLAGATPLDTFIDQHVAAMDGKTTVSIRRPDPYPAIHALLGRNFSPGVAAPANVGKSVQMSAGDFGLGVFGGVLGNITTWGIGQICEAAGCNYGTSGQLTQIQNSLTTLETQMTQVLTDLGTLQQSVTTGFSNIAVQNVVQQLQQVTNRIGTYSQNYQTTIPKIQESLVSPGTPIGAPPASAVTFVNNSLRFYYNANNGSMNQDINTLSQYLLGKNNQSSLPLLTNIAAAAQYGSNAPSANYLYVDTRSNAINESLCNQLDFYRAYQVLAFNLLAEYSHADANTFPTGSSNVPTNVLPANITSAVTTMRQMTADLVAEGQLAPPPTIASDEVFVGSYYMFYTTIQYQTYGKGIGTSVAVSALDSFSLGPWGQHLWNPPTLSAINWLHTAASNAGGGNVITGLQKLGFTVPSNASSSSFYIFINNLNGSVYDFNAGVVNNTPGFYPSLLFYLPARSTPGPTGTLTAMKPEDSGTVNAVSYPQSLAYSGSSNSALVTPTYPSWNIGAGYFANTVNLAATPNLAWSSSIAASLEISNIAGQQGTVVYHTASPGSGNVLASIYTSAITQTNGSVVPNTPLQLSTPFSSILSTLTATTPTNPTLVSIFITPQNRLYATTNETINQVSLYSDPYFATGSYSDGTYRDLTGQVTWTVTSTASAGNQPYLLTSPAVILKVPSSAGKSNLTITATITVTDPTTLFSYTVTGTSNGATEF